MVVMPGFTFYWPDWNRRMLMVFSMISKFCIKVGPFNSINMSDLLLIMQVMGHKSSEPVTPDQMMQVVVILLFVLAIIFHIFLSWLGF